MYTIWYTHLYVRLQPKDHLKNLSSDGQLFLGLGTWAFVPGLEEYSSLMLCEVYRLYAYLSIHPSVHPFNYLSIYLSIYPSIYLCVYIRHQLFMASRPERDTPMLRSCYTDDTCNGDDDVLRCMICTRKTWHKGNLMILYYSIYVCVCVVLAFFVAAAKMADIKMSRIWENCWKDCMDAEEKKECERLDFLSWNLHILRNSGIWKPFEMNARGKNKWNKHWENHVLAKWTKMRVVIRKLNGLFEAVSINQLGGISAE